MTLKSFNDSNAEACAAAQKETNWKPDLDEPQEDWWRTALTVNSWAYTPDSDSEEPKHRIPPHSYLVSHSSISQLGSSSYNSGRELNDLWLAPSLVGVRIVEDSIKPYEKAAGFHYTIFPKIEDAEMGLLPLLNLEATEQEIADNNRTWTDSLKDFISAVQEISFADSEGSLTSSFIESEPSSGSDNSAEFFTMPATPVLKDTAFSDLLVKAISPTSSLSGASVDEVFFSTPTPSKSLNAFASSFVPSFSPPAHTGTFSYASITDSLKEKTGAVTSRKREAETDSSLPSLSSFTFPTLNPPTKSTTRLTTVKIKKDDQGFFTDVQVDNSNKSESSTSKSLLPPFLQEPTPRRRARVSRTREIVDRLRSSQSETPSVADDIEVKKPALDFAFDLLPKSASLSPSPICHDGIFRPRSSVSENGRKCGRDSGCSTPSQEEDDEGWIDISSSSSTTSKTNRARDLFLAFTRRRTDSTSSEPFKEATPSEHSRGQSVDGEGETGPKQARCTSVSRDGWIESVETPSIASTPTGEPKGTGVKSCKSTPVTTSAATKQVPRKKPGHRHQSTGSASSFSPGRPAFTALSNPPFLNVPLISPTSHMNLIASPPPYYFTPTATSAYHPGTLSMPVAFTPVAFVAPTQYAPAARGVLPTPFIAPSAPSHAVPPGSQHHRKGSLSSW